MEPRQDGINAIGDFASRQRGLISAAQLRALGVSDRRLKYLVARRWLRPVHRGVYAVGHEALTLQASWLAAVMAIDGGVLSHRANGALWDIMPAVDRIDVTLTRPAGHVPRGVVVPHRRQIGPHEITSRRGIPCTTLVRTILDIGAGEPPWVLARAFEEAQVMHKLRPEAVAEALVLRRGHRGTARVREVVLDGVDPGAVQSLLEIRFLKFCRDVGLPRPETQHWIAGWPVDFYFADVDLAVETDGDAFHRTAAKRARDKRKTADVEAAGTPVLRLRWEEIVDRPRAAHARVIEARDAATTRRAPTSAR